MPAILHLPAPTLDARKRRAFDRLYEDALTDRGSGVPSVRYACPYPKHEFLHYLVAHRRTLVHGSTRPDIEVLEPRAESDNAGRVIHAVFAASDGVWAMFFAILARKPYPFSVDNGCRREAGGRAYHFSTSTLHDQPWTEGMIYVVPREPFEQMLDRDGRPTEQWMSRVAVRPLVKLPVAPPDFPFLQQVAYHDHPLRG